MVSFDKFSDDEHEAGVNLTVPGATAENIDESPHKSELTFVASYSLNGIEKSKTLDLKKGTRLSVGRTKENDLFIDDPSVSKIHASLAVDEQGNLIVADTGSTNGTFVNGARIAYGKAVFVADNSKVKFGAIDVLFTAEHIRRPSDFLPVAAEPRAAEIGTAQPTDVTAIAPNEPAATQPSVPVNAPAPTEPAINLADIPNHTTEGDPA
jgi:pSer/pThr/pTyr-binding forkhead associated (FHA) protein